MSKLNEYFAPKGLAYPGSACSTLQPYAGGWRGDGVLERLFAPAELPYPVPALPSAPAPGSGTPAVDGVRIVRVTIESPSVTSSLESERFEEVIDFSRVAHAVEIESAPVVLAVPDGFNKVELLFGSIVGADADALVGIGEPRIREGAVTPRGNLTVTVPWKFAPWLSLPARRLLVELVAVFSRTA